jgi:hypothetical protein
LKLAASPAQLDTMSQLQLFEPTTEKACSKCGIVQPLDAFHAKCTGKGQKVTHCRDCQAKRSLELQKLADQVSELRCYTCETVKPIGDFHRSSIRSSRSGKCKACNAAYHQDLAMRKQAEKIASGMARQCESCEKAKGPEQFADNATVCRQCHQHASKVAKRKERELAIASKPVATQPHLTLCTRCHEEKDTDAFHLKNDPRRPDRRDGTCKECRAIEAKVRYDVRCNVDPEFRERMATTEAVRRRGGRKREYRPMKEQQAAKAARLEEERRAADERATEREVERNTIDGRWNRLCASKARCLNSEKKDQDKWLARCQKAVSSLSSRRAIGVVADRRQKIEDWSSRVKSQLMTLSSREKHGWAKRIDNAVRMLHRRTKIKQQRRDFGGSLRNSITSVQLVA